MSDAPWTGNESAATSDGAPSSGLEAPVLTDRGGDRWADLATDGTVLVLDASTCVCGHAEDAHEHYRPGTDCALCDCPKFRRAR
ncbi:hypothetical protein [Curtobacterium sp. MCBA15_012]|uniref:hypothetical protein n=1 Tax=Curtobacterium sp. MCBA15_012 TaxID=1898738 RepID=UPI0008DE3EA5|nr:hypothetical protein [Curtobacterium sp. MCBA15_012]WIA98943.1 hypothetical protein QOL15_10330 [Curtobacterium sp. MCBA15_012]